MSQSPILFSDQAESQPHELVMKEQRTSTLRQCEKLKKNGLDFGTLRTLTNILLNKSQYIWDILKRKWHFAS